MYDKLTLNHFLLLLDLAETRQFKVTARRFGISSGSAARMLERCREAFNDELFTVLDGRLAPTQTFSENLPFIRETVQQWRRAFSTHKSDHAALPTFRIASCEFLVPWLMSRLLGYVKTHDIPVAFELSHHTTGLLKNFSDGRVDLAISVDTGLPSSLRVMHLFPLKLAVVMRRRHPLQEEPEGAEQLPLSMESLLPYRRATSAYSTNYGLAGVESAFMNDDAMMVLSGSGFDLIPILRDTDLVMLTSSVSAKLLAERFGLAYRLVKSNEFESPRHISMIWPEALHRNRLHAQLRALIKEEASVL